jgi:hypothetical protein
MMTTIGPKIRTRIGLRDNYGLEVLEFRISIYGAFNDFMNKAHAK